VRSAGRDAHAPDLAFRHEAGFYDGSDEFVALCLPFIREGLVRREPTLVVVDAPKIHLLGEALGDQASAVEFADMATVGRNPARIIPAWQAFVDRHADADHLRGIGEPIGPSRSQAELAECHRHEALLNVAFDPGRAWSLLCPYDVRALDPAVVDEARRTHPYVSGRTSDRYDGHPDLHPFSLGAPLPPPTGAVTEIAFGPATSLRDLRGLAALHLAGMGLGGRRSEDIVLAVDELVSNSLRHGGGAGTLRLWRDGDVALCEVQDHGLVVDPLAGRVRPDSRQVGGRGLWIVNLLCDLVQLRSAPGVGTTVRLHVRLD
jgi:anti-sigma regulatory factor (Ser/Thr protein kinase)